MENAAVFRRTRVVFHTPCRGGRLCPPSKFVDFSWSFVGADAHIGPLKCCEFASDFRKNAQFRRADRVVRPYGAKSRPIRIRRKTTIKQVLSAGRCGHRPLRCEMENAAIFATPTVRNGQRGASRSLFKRGPSPAVRVPELVKKLLTSSTATPLREAVWLLF